MASAACTLTIAASASFSNSATRLRYPRRYPLSQFLTSGFRSGDKVCFLNNANASSYRCCSNRKLERFECRAADSSATSGELSKGTLIWRAIKLPIYAVALVPLTVGSAAATLETGLFSARQYFTLLASSVLVIAWLNLSADEDPCTLHSLPMLGLQSFLDMANNNDVYDFDTGADKNKKESVVNMVGSRTGTLAVAYALLALGFAGLSWATAVAGNFRAILLLVSSTTCGYIYQCPPFRLSYKGLGEPLCFAAFGPFTTTAFYLMQAATREMIYPQVTATVLSSSVLVGFTTTLILFCSHFHQVEEDRTVGKMSPLVRIGTEKGSKVVKTTVMMLYLLLFAFGLAKALPWTCILTCSLTIPMAKMVVRYVEDNYKDNTKIFMAKYYCVRLHALFGAALAAGLVAAKLLTQALLSTSLKP